MIILGLIFLLLSFIGSCFWSYLVLGRVQSVFGVQKKNVILFSIISFALAALLLHFGLKP